MERSSGQEYVVMTTRAKTDESTVVTVENRPLNPAEVAANSHVAGGPHSGIIVHKDVMPEEADSAPAHHCLHLRTWLVDKSTGTRSQDLCRVDFWFKSEALDGQAIAADFTKRLLSQDSSHYVAFVTQILKLMRTEFQSSVLKVRLQRTSHPNPEPPTQLDLNENNVKTSPLESKCFSAQKQPAFSSTIFRVLTYLLRLYLIF